MTTTPTDQRALVERLRAELSNGGDGEHADLYLVNPDGPEAADLIEALQAEYRTLEFDSGKAISDLNREVIEWQDRALAVEQRGDQGSSSAKAPTIPAVDGDGSNLNTGDRHGV